MPKTTPSRRWRRTLRRCRPVLKRQGFSPGSWSRRERKRTSTKPPRRKTAPACVADAVAGEPAKDFSRSSSAAPSNPTSHGSGVQRPPATRSGEEEAGAAGDARAKLGHGCWSSSSRDERPVAGDLRRSLVPRLAGRRTGWRRPALVH